LKADLNKMQTIDTIKTIVIVVEAVTIFVLIGLAISS
jgi:hypothetical protein